MGGDVPSLKGVNCACEASYLGVQSPVRMLVSRECDARGLKASQLVFPHSQLSASWGRLSAQQQNCAEDRQRGSEDPTAPRGRQVMILWQITDNRIKGRARRWGVGKVTWLVRPYTVRVLQMSLQPGVD
ncbi:hypothetical protein GWK47_043960 [Chionoecetes opilio]|uniref:Uncharacterized protein n=1 Tax=Chionoecetes opilio TaxID=41210 RepID=A0A8J5CYD9_CHIOP|nr:hypothetical protein GWK47_043960 [Chionoecetes opilio]